MADRYCDGLGPGYDRHRGEREYARRQDALSQTPKPTPAPAGAAIEALVEKLGRRERLCIYRTSQGAISVVHEHYGECLDHAEGATLAEALARLAGKETT